MAVSIITRGLNFVAGLKPKAAEWNNEFDAPYNSCNALARLMNGTTTIDNTMKWTASWQKPLLFGTVRVWDVSGVLYAKPAADPTGATDGVPFAFASLT